MFSRRAFLKALGIGTLGSLALGGYAFGVEPMRLRIQRYKVNPPRWPEGFALKIAVVADLHACDPWMSLERISYIVEQTNQLNPDVIVLLGDFAAGHRWVTKSVHSKDWSKALSALSAPLGVHAILGNHDWWDDDDAQRRGAGPTAGHLALEKVGIRVYENDTVKLQKGAHSFWIAGLGDQLALLPGRRFGRSGFQGVDDLPLTLSKVTDDAPIILLAHEPDVFPTVPERVSLTLSGHTHGGQIRLFNYSPVVPSRYKNRYAYGHVVESLTGETSRNRHLIVSGGLGCSIAPVRFGVPPEINLIEVGA